VNGDARDLTGRRDFVVASGAALVAAVGVPGVALPRRRAYDLVIRGGTVFDGYVNDEGEIAVLLMDGAVDVCNAGHECNSLDQAGYFIHVGRRGIISRAVQWNGRWLGGVGVGRAFPFVGRRLRIDPVARFRRADLMGGRLIRNVPGVPGAIDRGFNGVRPNVPNVRPRIRAPRLRAPRIPGIRR